MYYIFTRNGIAVASGGAAADNFINSMLFQSADAEAVTVFAKTAAGETIYVTASSLDEAQTAMDVAAAMVERDLDPIVKVSGGMLLGAALASGLALNPVSGAALALAMGAGYFFEEWIDFSRNVWRNVFDEAPVISPLTLDEQAQLAQMMAQGYYDSENGIL